VRGCHQKENNGKHSPGGPGLSRSGRGAPTIGPYEFPAKYTDRLRKNLSPLLPGWQVPASSPCMNFKNSSEFLGLCQQQNNPNFNLVEIDHFRISAGRKAFFNLVEFDHFRLSAGGKAFFNLVEFDHFRLPAGGKAFF
jgi:hypothetical protein